MCEAFLPETKESVSGLQGAKEAQGFSTNCLPLSDPCFWDSKVSRFDMPLLCVFAFQVSNNPFLPLDGGFNAGRGTGCTFCCGTRRQESYRLLHFESKNHRQQLKPLDAHLSKEPHRPHIQYSVSFGDMVASLKCWAAKKGLAFAWICSHSICAFSTLTFFASWVLTLFLFSDAANAFIWLLKFIRQFFAIGLFGLSSHSKNNKKQKQPWQAIKIVKQLTVRNQKLNQLIRATKSWFLKNSKFLHSQLFDRHGLKQ